MTNYTVSKLALAIMMLPGFASAGHAQVAPTPEQVDFVKVVGKRIRAALQADIATSKTQELEPAITAEQQLARTWTDLFGQASRLDARIKCLDWYLQQRRANADRDTMQQIDSWRRELFQLNSQFANLNDRLKAASAGFKAARERRLAAERVVASKEGTNQQQLKDLTYLLNMWLLNPPQYTWEAMRDHVTEIAREKQLTSNVTVSAGTSPVTLKYQLVSGGPVFSAASCTRCVIRPAVGHYNFWVETAGTAGAQKTAYFISGESHSIQIGQTSSR
jgi:hypothetical protein